MGSSVDKNIRVKPRIPKLLKNYVEIQAGLPGDFRFFWGGGGIRYIWGEHSVEDNCLHINGIIFGGGEAYFWGGDSPQNRPLGSPDKLIFTLFFKLALIHGFY